MDKHTPSIAQKMADREHGYLDDTAYHEKTKEMVERLCDRERKPQDLCCKNFNTDWNDVRLYDLIIDMGSLSMHKAVDLICENPKHNLKA